MLRYSDNQIWRYQQDQSESILQAKSATVQPEPIPCPCQKIPDEVPARQEDEKPVRRLVHLADTFQSLLGVHWGAPDTVAPGRWKFQAALVFHPLAGLPRHDLGGRRYLALLQTAPQSSISLLKKDRLAKVP